LIIEEQNIIDQAWVQVTVCFTADDDYDLLWIYPQMTQNFTFGNNAVVYLDRIVLVEDTYSAGIDRNIVCGNTTLGEISCEADSATYSWTIQGNTSVLGTGQQLLVNANATATYEVTRSYPNNPGTVVSYPTNSYECTLVDQVVVTVTAPLIVTTDFTDATCGNCNGTAEVTGITNGTSPFFYLWEDAGEQSVSITAEAEDLCPGTYTVYVTDDEGCVATEEVIITDDSSNCGCFPTPGTNSGSWPKHGESDEKTRAHTILVDDEGNVYVTGFMYGFTDFDLTDFATIAPETAIDMFVARYSHDGNSDWVRQFGNDAPDPYTTDNVGFDLAIGSDCNLIVTGKYDNSIDLDNITLNGSALQGFIMKLDALDGSVLAAANLTVGLSFQAVAVSPVTGNIYTMGKELDSYPDHTVVVSKFNSNLNAGGTASFGTVNNDDIFGITGEITRGISVDGDDNVYVTVNLTDGGSFGGQSVDNASILKYDVDLAEVTAIELTASGFSYVLDIATGANGVSYVAGGNGDLTVAELPASLASVTDDWLFEQYFMGTAIDIDDDYFYYAGMDGSTDIVAGKALRSDGSSEFSSIYTSDVSVCNSISADSDGNAYIAGAFTDEMTFDNVPLTASNSTHFDMYATRLDAIDGELFKLEGDEEGPSAEQPRAHRPFMAEVYPNPTDGLLHVRLHGIEDGQRAVAELYDMRGALLHWQVFAEHGGQEHNIGLQHLPPAPYLLKLSAHGHRSFHRVTLAR
jgi:hypothetical protein